MISPFEQTGAAVDANLPVRLLSAGAKDVSRLEFCSMEAAKGEVEVELEREAPRTELRLEEQVAELEERLKAQVEETGLQIELARSVAKADADREWQSSLDEGVATERARVLAISCGFEKERGRYFAGVEAEVVKLSLAIAARVLHREAKLDPLLLAGVVRVALGKIADDSVIVLRVPAVDLEPWRDAFRVVPETRLQLTGDETLSTGECLLETSVGRVELGVNAQLQEIERGFFDLLQQRPA